MSNFLVENRDEVVAVLHETGNEKMAKAGTTIERMCIDAETDIATRLVELYVDILKNTGEGEASANACAVSSIVGALRLFIPMPLDFNERMTKAAFNGLGDIITKQLKRYADEFDEAMTQSDASMCSQSRSS